MSQREIAPRPQLDEIAGKLKNALELTQRYKDFYEEGLKLDPAQATFAGDNRYNDQLPNTLTDQYQQQLRDYYQKYHDLLNAVDRNSLPPAEQLNVDALRWECEIGLAGLKFRTEFLPLNQFHGLNLIVATWAGGTGAQPFKTVRDYENWLQRLDAFTHWCHTAVTNMRVGMKRGYVHGITADERPCKTIKDPVSIPDLHATIYRALGIHADHHYEVEKRPFYLTNDGKGKAVMELFG